MKSFVSALAAATTALWLGAASAVTISDPTDWASGWVYLQVEAAGAGTVSLAVEPTSGNPGARLNVTTVTPTGADIVYGAAVYQAGSVPSPASGIPFVMHIDVLSGPGGFGGGQAVQALVSQNATLYETPVGITGWPINSFTTLTYNGTFTAGAFTKVSGPGAALPSFDGVTPTSFGFAVGNSMSATLTQYYDNWNITFGLPVSGAAAVPLLSNGALLMLVALLALATFAARRRRR